MVRDAGAQAQLKRRPPPKSPLPRPVCQWGDRMRLRKREYPRSPFLLSRAGAPPYRPVCTALDANPNDPTPPLNHSLTDRDPSRVTNRVNEYLVQLYDYETHSSHTMKQRWSGVDGSDKSVVSRPSSSRLWCMSISYSGEYTAVIQLYDLSTAVWTMVYRTTAIYCGTILVDLHSTLCEKNTLEVCR